VYGREINAKFRLENTKRIDNLEELARDGIIILYVDLLLSNDSVNNGRC
jgi:hypothetical protein